MGLPRLPTGIVRPAVAIGRTSRYLGSVCSKLYRRRAHSQRRLEYLRSLARARLRGKTDPECLGFADWTARKLVLRALASYDDFLVTGVALIRNAGHLAKRVGSAKLTGSSPT